MMRWLKDWWRGWDESDMASFWRKAEDFENVEPGQAIPITDREHRAYRAHLREAYRVKRGWRE